MKKMMLTLILGLVSINAFSATKFSREVSELYDVSFRINGVERNFVSGHLDINNVENEINVSIIGENNCPQGAFCVRGPEFRNFTAEIVSRKKDGCGIVHIKAITNQLPVDGALTHIEVSDTSHVKCRMLYPAPTLVEIKHKVYNRIEGKEYSSNLTAKGTILRPVRIGEID